VNPPRALPPSFPAAQQQALGVADDSPAMAAGILTGFVVLPVGAAVFAHLVGASWKSAALLGGAILGAEVAAVASGAYHP
jgi:hypothetical protein